MNNWIRGKLKDLNSKPQGVISRYLLKEALDPKNKKGFFRLLWVWYLVSITLENEVKDVSQS